MIALIDIRSAVPPSDTGAELERSIYAALPTLTERIKGSIFSPRNSSSQVKEAEPRIAMCVHSVERKFPNLNNPSVDITITLPLGQVLEHRQSDLHEELTRHVHNAFDGHGFTLRIDLDITDRVPEDAHYVLRPLTATS